MSPTCFLLKNIFWFHSWMSWKSYDLEIRVDHVEFVAMDEIFFLRILHHDES